MNLQKLCEAVDQSGKTQIHKGADGKPYFEFMAQSDEMKDAVVLAHILSLDSDEVHDDTLGNLDWKEVICQSLMDQAHVGLSISMKAYSMYETEIRSALEYGYIEHLKAIEAGNAVDSSIKDAKELAA